jgi:hypothetical protein
MLTKNSLETRFDFRSFIKTKIDRILLALTVTLTKCKIKMLFCKENSSIFGIKSTNNKTNKTYLSDFFLI